MIDADKKRLDEDTMSQIRHEIGEVITKYVDIEPENMEIKIVFLIFFHLKFDFYTQPEVTK